MAGLRDDGTPASPGGAGVPTSTWRARARGVFPARRTRAAAGASARGGRAALGACWLALGAACGAPGEPPPTLETEEGTVELEDSADLHEVSLVRSEAGERFSPASIDAASGDVVRFTSETLDTHALAFRMDRLTAEQQGFLAESGQEASAPILERGHSWVLTLEGAPAGSYPFVCLIHDAEGILRVAAAS